MKNLKDFMPSDESEVIDLRKMQGPPTKEIAEEMARAKAWDDYYAKQREGAKKRRDAVADGNGKMSKNGAEYGARMKRYDKAVAAKQAEDDQASDDAVRAYNKGFKGSKQYKRDLKGISKAFNREVDRKAVKKKAEGGVVRGVGKASGVNPYKVR